MPQVWGLVLLGHVNPLLSLTEPQVLEVGHTTDRYISLTSQTTSAKKEGLVNNVHKPCLTRMQLARCNQISNNVPLKYLL